MILKHKKRGLWVAALGLMMSAGAAHAQGISIGVVDEDKLADGYTAYKTEVDTIDKRAQSLDAQIPAREFLNEAESKTFDALILNFTRTPAQNTELDSLVKVGMDRRAGFMNLVGKATRNDAENAQMKTSQDIMTRNATGVRALSENLLGAIRKQQEETDKKYTDRANTVVGQVASDRKMALVVRKRAVIWNTETIDITSEVSTRLNR